MRNRQCGDQELDDLTLTVGDGHGLPRSGTARDSRSLVLGLAVALLLAVGASGCGGSYGEPPSTDPTTDQTETQSGDESQAEYSIGYVRDLTPGEFRSYMQSYPGAFLLDVRLPPEWDGELGHLDGAVLIPVQELEDRLGELPADRNRPILVYCRTGNRSSRAAQIIAEQGYREVFNLQGGLTDYREEGY
jgi:rhodanese-related sulfurtransferase